LRQLRRAMILVTLDEAQGYIRDLARQWLASLT
jgi:hypothetical protein